MEIIKRGESNKVIECDCGCVFRYTDKDTQWFKCSTGGEVVFVSCPECEEVHIIEQPENFKGKITKVDKKQKILDELKQIMLWVCESPRHIDDDLTEIIPMKIYEAGYRKIECLQEEK